jgi:hypothetical protein
MRYTLVTKEPVFNDLLCHEQFPSLDLAVDFIEEVAVRSSHAPWLLPVQSFRATMYNKKRKKFRLFDNMLKMEIELLRK